MQSSRCREPAYHTKCARKEKKVVPSFSRIIKEINKKGYYLISAAKHNYVDIFQKILRQTFLDTEETTFEKATDTDAHGKYPKKC